MNAVAFADESSQILFSGADDGLCKVREKYDRFLANFQNYVGITDQFLAKFYCGKICNCGKKYMMNNYC